MNQTSQPRANRSVILLLGWCMASCGGDSQDTQENMLAAQDTATPMSPISPDGSASNSSVGGTDGASTGAMPPVTVNPPVSPQPPGGDPTFATPPSPFQPPNSSPGASNTTDPATSTTMPTLPTTGPGGGDGGSGGAPTQPGETGGSPEMSGGAPSDPVTSGDCTFEVSSEVSDVIATVGIVNWSTDLPDLTSASIEFAPQDGGDPLTAPVDLEDREGDAFRTLLLGMKQGRTYDFRIMATSATTSCSSESYSITTGMLAGAPQVSREGMNANASVGGFIVTSSGLSFGMGIGGISGVGGGGGGGPNVFIIDADGDVVWAVVGPNSASRAHMSYDGKRMWMMELNVENSGGEMRWVTMDGKDSESVAGLAAAHHDFCIRPDNGVSTMLWDGGGRDPVSYLAEWYPDGRIENIVRIDENIYRSSTYHSNAIHYYPDDGSYTISDRNPNLFVKVSGTGQVLWQFGGDCSNAPAPKCASGNWQVNHGHDLTEDGRFVFFNNGLMGASTIFDYKLTETANGLTAEMVDSHSDSTSMVLGDVQALPNGGMLVTYSNSGIIDELDASGNRVQRLTASAFGYSDWRPTLYGPPVRY